MSYSAGKFSMGRSQPRFAKIGVSYRPIKTMSNWPLPVDTSVVTRCRSTFSSTITQLSFISGFFSSNFGESFLSSIMSGLLTVAMVTVFCWAIAQALVNRIVIKISIYLFIVWAGLSLVYLLVLSRVLKVRNRERFVV